jgi:hypothetical protein
MDEGRESPTTDKSRSDRGALPLPPYMPFLYVQVTESRMNQLSHEVLYTLVQICCAFEDYERQHAARKDK